MDDIICSSQVAILVITPKDYTMCPSCHIPPISENFKLPSNPDNWRKCVPKKKKKKKVCIMWSHIIITL